MQNGDALIINQRRYRLDERIAPGAYGEVWAATAPDGRPVAIKFVNTARMTQVDPTFGPQWRAHLEREIEFLRQLGDAETAHIVRLLDHGEVDSQPALVLERMEANLDQWLGKWEKLTGSPRPLPPRQLLDWAHQILAGLETVHAHHLVYRDLKLSNVLVSENGQRLKLADFGTLKPPRDEGTVSFAGTLTTMAPEQRLPARYQDGRPVYDFDYRADFYALGLILFALLTGQRILTSQIEIEQMLDRVGHEGASREGQNLGGLNDQEKSELKRALWTQIVGNTTFGPGQARLGSLAQSLYELMLALLAPRQEDRPASAEPIRAVLDAVLAALPEESQLPPVEPPSPNPPSLLVGEGWGGENERSSPGPSRRGWVYALIGVAGLAVVAFGLNYWRMLPDNPIPFAKHPPAPEQPTPAPATASAPTPTSPVAKPAPAPTATPNPAPPAAKPFPKPTTTPAVVSAPAPTAATSAPTPGAAPAPTVATSAPTPGAAPAPASSTSAPIATTPVPAPTAMSTATPPPAWRDKLANGRSSGPELIIAPAGTLTLPGVDGQPGYEVAIQPFALAYQPVTFADYELFARQTQRSLPYSSSLRPEERATRPVIAITWDEAQAYVEWLSQQTGQYYRLPSEAEWMYAEQVGIGKRGDIAWEWVADCASGDPTALPLSQTARGQEDGGDCRRRVRRSGGINGEPFPADKGSRDIGFRVVRELSSDEKRPKI